MHRTWVQRLLLLVLLVLIPIGAATAQTAGRTLTSGIPIVGTLDGSAIVQVYTLDAAAGQTVEIIVQNTLGVPLAVTLTSAAGDLVGQSVDDDADGRATLSLSLLTDGAYYITVFKAGGVGSISSVPFTLSATATNRAASATIETTAEATIAPEATQDTFVAVTPFVDPANTFTTGQLVTQSGMTISLTWNSTDDLDLEVRDPVGGSLYWETPTVASGGTHSGNINQQCAVTTADAPTETATWSPGGIPTGGYEVLVYFQGSCNNGAPASFTINVGVNGINLPPVQSSINAGDVFVAGYEVEDSGASALTGLSGVVTDFLPDTVENILAAATPIQFGIPLGGVIENGAPYRAFTFDGRTNDSITVSLEATGGSLDSFLFLLDGAGNVVQINDDADIGITNSLIQNALLPFDGTYTIVASRYGKRIGGTEGPFTINVTSQALDLPAEFLALPRGALEVRLLWNTGADLQLLVRDSAGNAVFDDVPEIRSGGRLAAQGNVNCRASTGTPFSYVYWPTELPPRPGVYEVEVWFQNDCDDLNPVSASLFVTYNGQQIFNDTIRPSELERYLTSFTINADGTAEPSDGGIIRGVTDLNYTPELAAAAALLAGEPRSGIITQDNKFDVFLFTGTAGEVVNIAMNNTSGTLDPLLYVVDTVGNVVAENDDAVAGENTDALIANLALPADGQYIIIATHFGGRYGGTTGTYALTLTRLN
ncbi:MAG: PPC domain-containing protein [Chloroflexota bacterium]|nr:PPC domain-containing protein [Chloroflexota bacterium]